jgi:hypothetical protein
MTERGSRKAVREGLKEQVQYPEREWVARGKSLLSVHDLSLHPWNKVVDPGTVEEFDASEWADSDDEQKRRDFVELLNHCLDAMLGPAHIRYNERTRLYYFTATSNLERRFWFYVSVKHRARKEVFGARLSKRDPTRVAYYRHSAFNGHFSRHDGSWFLEIEPTYHFTSDGWHADRFAADRLTGIKRLERNPSVLGQLRMWVGVLTPPSTLYKKRYPYLAFGELEQFGLPCGLDDHAWLKREDDPPLDESAGQMDTLWD